MRVVVTGGAGQLGSLVLRRLVDDRAIGAVRCIDVRPPMLAHPKLESFSGDVRAPELDRYFQGFDAVVHLAFAYSERDLSFARSVNVEGSRNVFEAAARAGIRRIVYGSSIAAYGVVHGHTLPITEDAPRQLQLDFAYAATRFEVEALLDRFEQRHPELGVVRLRPSVLIGCRMEHPVGAILRRHILIDAEGAPTPVVWDEDVADAVVLALKRDMLRGAFNLCADEPLPPHEVSRIAGLRLIHVPREIAVAASRLQPLLARLTGQPIADPAWVRHSNVPMTVSCDRARNVLGWRPLAPTSREVWKQFADTVPWRTDRRILFFFSLVNAAAWRGPTPGLHGIDARIHLALTGSMGGDFTIDVSDDRLRVRRGIPRPPTATLTLSAALFLDLLAGKAELDAALRTGRVRLDGPERAALLLNGMVTMFREELGDREGLPSRWLGHWLARR